MNTAAEYAAIVAKLEAVSPIPTARISYELANKGPFAEPAWDGTAAGVASAWWLRFFFLGLPGSSRQLGLGSYAPNYRHDELWLELFTPAKTGEQSTGSLFWTTVVDPLLRSFSRLSLTTSDPLVTVQFLEAATPRRVGVVGNWSKVNLAFPYYVLDFTG